MDKDISDLKMEFGVQRSLLQALAQTQSEHTATLADHTARLERLETGMTHVRTGVQTIIGLLDREPGD